MTISLHQDAVLYVLSRAPQSPYFPTAYQIQPPDDDAEIDVRPAKDDQIVLVPISPFRALQVPQEQCRSTNDDSLRDVRTSGSRRVSFAEPLVTDVRTRPHTHPDDVGALFYSYEETQRFRQEYRMERQMKEDLEDDPATVSTSSTRTQTSEDDLSSSSWQPLGRRHHISRVVIRHHETLATFYDSSSHEKKHRNDSLSTVGSGDSDMDTTQQEQEESFFDNDSFWSGSITWY